MKWLPWLWIAVQIVLPLSYYLGWRGEDERFAWRMFSPHVMDADRCKMRVRETRASGQSYSDPLLMVHSAFAHQMLAGSETVSEQFLAWRCDADRSVTRLDFEHRCEHRSNTRQLSRVCAK